MSENYDQLMLREETKNNFLNTGFEISFLVNLLMSLMSLNRQL
jgi:hypothetical protein